MIPNIVRAALAAVLVVVLSLVACVALAAGDDLPARVGRVADFTGDVFSASDEHADDWTAIGLNQPVTSGDNLWVAENGRGEIDYGGGQLRIGGGTNVHVSRLDEHELGLFVAQGSVIVRVRALDAGDVAYVDTPNTQLQLRRVGLYRIDVDPDRRTTTLIVREGEATAALASGAQQVLPGQTATIEGIDASDADMVNGVVVDAFDTWSIARDRHYERSMSARYVSPQMVGYADLDSYGTWETTTTYGPVWYPTAVVGDWAPYRFGHWTWVRGFGYAWVDDAPWGYAPFHYGRWVYVGGRWGWCPGQYVARPVWAPALVAWYGGSGWSLSTSYGAPVYGWVPLAWGEPFVPWWGRCSNACWVRYNRPYAVNVAERPARAAPVSYANLRVPGAITAVPAATLAGARAVATSRVPVQAAVAPPPLASAPPVKPLVAAAAPTRTGAPPAASALYPPTKPRVVPAPAYVAPATAPVSRAAPAASIPPRVEPRARPVAPPPNVAQPMPAPPPNVAQPIPAPAPNAPRAIAPKPREVPREVRPAVVAPVPAARASVPVAPLPATPPAPAARASVPTAPLPATPPAPAAHPAAPAQPAAAPTGGRAMGHPPPQERANAAPHGAPQEAQR